MSYSKPSLPQLSDSRLILHSLVANKQHQKTQGKITIVEKSLKIILWIPLLVPWSKPPSSRTGTIANSLLMAALQTLQQLPVVYRRKSKSFSSACKAPPSWTELALPMTSFCYSFLLGVFPFYCLRNGSSFTLQYPLLSSDLLLFVICSNVTVSERFLI